MAWFETVWNWLLYSIPFPFNVISQILFLCFLFALPIAITSTIIDLITGYLGKE